MSLLGDKLKNSLNKNLPIIARSALQVEGNSAANILKIASTNFRTAHKTEKEFSNIAIACEECCSVCSTRLVVHKVLLERPAKKITENVTV